MPDNHFTNFPYDLQEIYKDNIIDKCVLSMISSNEKYKPLKSQIVIMNTHMSTNDDVLPKKLEPD